MISTRSRVLSSRLMSMTKNSSRDSIFQNLDPSIRVNKKVGMNLDTDPIKWAESFCSRFYRYNGARKEYIKHLDTSSKVGQVAMSNIHSLPRDLLESNTADPNRLKVFQLLPNDNSIYPQYDPVNFEVTFAKSMVDCPDETFDVVILPMVLSSLPNPQLRLQHIQAGRRLLRNPGFGGQPHRAGLLIVLEKQEVFLSAKVLEDVCSDKRREQHNKELLADWKRIISEVGFREVKYKTIKSEDTSSSGVDQSTDVVHAFVFRTILPDPRNAAKTEGTSNSISKDAGRREYFMGVYAEPMLWSMTDFASNSGVADSIGVGRQAKPPVAIVGGGLGGIALALALMRKGVRVNVFEKDASFASRRQGYALTLQQANSALSVLGLSKSLMVQGLSSVEHISLSSSGEVLGAYSSQDEQRRLTQDSELLGPSCPTKRVRSIRLRAFKSTEHSTQDANSNANADEVSRRARRHNIHVPRQMLRELLFKQMGDAVDCVLWNKQLVRFSNSSDDSVMLEFSDGSRHPASVLVGADGIHSVLRRQISAANSNTKNTLVSPLKYLGLIVILGISPTLISCDDAPISEGNMSTPSPSDTRRRSIQWVDGTARIFTMPFNETHSMWQLSFPCDEDTAIKLTNAADALRDLALSTLQGWDQAAVDLVTHTDPRDISGHPVYDRDPLVAGDISSTLGEDARVTLIGDAAHPMSPFKGQGANQAIVDAVSLATCLMSSDLVRAGPGRCSVAASLRAFEQEMCSRTSGKVLGSRDAAYYLHSQDALAHGDITRAAAAALKAVKK